MIKRPSNKIEPVRKPPAETCKNLLAFRAGLMRSREALKDLADEILRVLAKDVLLSQVHQGRPIEVADIGAFDCFFAAQKTPPHIYLTLIEVAGWASPDDDPRRNSEMVSGLHTEGVVKDGILYVSLLTDTKVSRFYLSEKSLPDDNETLPFLRGDPIPVIAGPCSAADLWCALQVHGRVARLPDTLQKRGWKSAMLAIFQQGDGSVSARATSRHPSRQAEEKERLTPKNGPGKLRTVGRPSLRHVPVPTPLEEKVRELETALEDARETIIHLVPPEFSEILDSYDRCESTADFRVWKETVAERIAANVPESSIIDTTISRRANCPLCQRATFGIYSDGFKLPLGLVRHLTGYGNVHQCEVTKAAFALGRDYVERRYGEAERAAKKAEDEEKARQTEVRRKTDTLYKVHPIDPPQLIDDGYRSWFGELRKPERLEWAKARAKSLGFISHVDGNVQSLEKQKAHYVIYADIRSEKKITFNIFRLPITKGKKLWQSNFDFPDSYKNDIEEKFNVRLNEALERLGPR
jgi:hypothetical protein